MSERDRGGDPRRQAGPGRPGLLEEETPAACLTVERTVYDDTGRFVEHDQHVYRSSPYKLQNLLVG